MDDHEREPRRYLVHEWAANTSRSAGFEAPRVDIAKSAVDGDKDERMWFHVSLSFDDESQADLWASLITGAPRPKGFGEPVAIAGTQPCGLDEVQKTVKVFTRHQGWSAP
jgi:hypothetical protein